MKRVVNSSMVAHLWANQSQSGAKTANGNLYFRDSKIFSYGSHFPIAAFHTTVSGERVVLFTTRSYSRTTARHISLVRAAIRGRAEHVIACQHVDGPDRADGHRDNLRVMREECLVMLEKASKARSYSARYLQDAEAVAENHLAYRTAFGMALDEPLAISEAWKKEALGRVAAQRAIAGERAEQHRKQAALRLTKKLADLERWKTDPDYIYGSFHELPVALRHREGTKHDGDYLEQIIETSRGAQVPANHARRIWGLINKIRATGVPYQSNGHSEHVGAFTVDSIATDGTLVAGCHTITFEAMAELAGKLGW